MRISQKLEKAISFDPTRRSHPRTILDLCKEIKSNKISLPLYQRDLSWTISKCIELLNYQLLGKAPVAPISINVIDDLENKQVSQVSFINRELINNVQNNHWSVVDGQQRLTTNFKAYINHEDFRSIVLDLGTAQFVENATALKINQIPVGILLNEDDDLLKQFINNRKQLQPYEVYNVILGVRQKLTNYNYTINFAQDLSEKEQIKWFEVLNNAGSRVSIIQMRFSKLKSDGIDIYKQYTSIFNEKIIEFGYNVFTPEKTTVSYPIAALNPVLEKHIFGSHLKSNFAPIPSDTKENQLCSHVNSLESFFVITLAALDKVLDFINENELDIKDRIDYINYMIGYFVFNSDNIKLKISEEQKSYLIDWYNTIDFNNMSNSKRRQTFTDMLENKYL